MKEYLRNWNFMRLLRLALGIFIIVQGIQTRMWLFVFVGAIYAMMPLLNVGCCGTSGCAPKSYKNYKSSNEEIHYEEVK